MKKKIIILISILFIFIIASVFIYTKIADNTNIDNAKDYNNKSIEGLVNSSLLIQYSNDNTNLDNVFTKDFINKMDQSSNFYKKDLSPYKIVNQGCINSLTKVNENEFTVSVNIEDKRGRYIQIIHIIKLGDIYYISDIEYDI